jgi:hypothetical protein
MTNKPKKPEVGDTDCLDLPSKAAPRTYGNGKPKNLIGTRTKAAPAKVELPNIDPALHSEPNYLKEMAKSLTLESMLTLVDIMRNGRNDNARGAAAREILDRGWGKAHVQIEEPTATHTNIQVVFGDSKKPDGSDPA